MDGGKYLQGRFWSLINVQASAWKIGQEPRGDIALMEITVRCCTYRKVVNSRRRPNCLLLLLNDSVGKNQIRDNHIYREAAKSSCTEYVTFTGFPVSLYSSPTITWLFRSTVASRSLVLMMSTVCMMLRLGDRRSMISSTVERNQCHRPTFIIMVYTGAIAIYVFSSQSIENFYGNVSKTTDVCRL